MNTFVSIVRGIGYLLTAVGVLSLVNTAFGLHLRYRGTNLPNDYVAAGALLVIGVVVAGIGYLMGRRRG
ncbi:MAG: hypothetical protein JXA20_17750 [Spirochaetes bacterium]|nr:hypothetical protein [Spirochaetota bacterium]